MTTANDTEVAHVHVWLPLLQAGEYGSTVTTDWAWCQKCGAVMQPQVKGTLRLPTLEV